MKIIFILIACLTFVSGICEIFFIDPSILEISQIKQEMSFFYGQELFKAGIFDNEDRALREANNECNIEFSTKKCCYYWLLSSNEKIGYLVYSLEDGSVYLEAIYLYKKSRGQGFGKQILQDFEKHLKEKNIDTIRLYVFAHNKIAFNLYEKMGYTIEKSYSAENRIIGYHMKKKL